MDSFHRNSHYSPPYRENVIPQPSYCQFQSPPQVVYSQAAQNFDPSTILTPLVPTSPYKEIKDMLLEFQKSVESKWHKQDEQLLAWDRKLEEINGQLEEVARKQELER